MDGSALNMPGSRLCRCSSRALPGSSAGPGAPPAAPAAASGAAAAAAGWCASAAATSAAMVASRWAAVSLRAGEAPMLAVPVTGGEREREEERA